MESNGRKESRANRFSELLRGIRAGEAAAIEQFLEDYQPHVRRVVRARMRLRSLRRIADSSDFCQSVMGAFLIRVALGEFDLEGPDKLIALLGKNAMNKVAALARKPEYLQGVPIPIGQDGREIVALGPGPATMVLWQDLLQGVHDRLIPEERKILDLRIVEGLSWDEIAARLGGSAEALRKQLGRARERVVAELGLQDADHA